MNTFLVIVQTALGFSFTVFLWMGRYRVAGFLEWSLCYVGSVWLTSFVGYVRCVCRSQVVARELTVLRRFREDNSNTGAVGERQPLLGTLG